MSRRRYVYREVEPGKVEAFEVGADWVPEGRGPSLKSEEEVFGKLQATDGTDLSTRKRHREYQKAHGLALADDYRETWAKAEERRAEAFTGKANSKAIRESVEKAIYKLTEGKRRR